LNMDSPPKKRKTIIGYYSKSTKARYALNVVNPKEETEKGSSQTPKGFCDSTGDQLQDATAPKLRTFDSIHWKRIQSENLNLDYCRLFEKQEADSILEQCEQELEYNTGQLARVHVFGKWHNIPRKQVAFGDEGLSYTFSRNAVPAREWIPLLARIRDQISALTGFNFNFVLINRYNDGLDYMGEHKDDEKELEEHSPIASLSFGQMRPFVFRHGKSRGKHATKKIEPITIDLEHGSLLMMKYPTNQHWYHSLPKRKNLQGVRLNMTFRRMSLPKPKK